jgi:hypothetical protein
LLAVVFTAVHYRSKSEYLKRLLNRRPFPYSNRDNYEFITHTTVLISSSEKHLFEISICDESNRNAPKVLVGPVVLDKGDYVVTAFIDEPLSIFGFTLSHATGLESELYFTHLDLPKGSTLLRPTNSIADEPQRNGVYAALGTGGRRIEIQFARKKR